MPRTPEEMRVYQAERRARLKAAKVQELAHSLEVALNENVDPDALAVVISRLSQQDRDRILARIRSH